MSLFHRKSSAKDLKINLFIYFVFFVLFLIFLFSIFNLVSIIRLQGQINFLLNNTEITREGEVITGSKSTAIPISKLIYYNVNSETFLGSDLINTEKTNLVLDDLVTAMTFKPLYELKEEKLCENIFCGLQTFNNLSCLKSACVYKKNQQLYFNNSLVELPKYLKDKNIIDLNFNSLDTKWVISFIVKEEDQEAAYVYLFDGINWEGIITNDTTQKIKTKYGYLGGTITAAGSDNQFIVLYSGYEGLAYLYNEGKLQDLSKFFGLRVTNSGFKAKIIKDGDGKLANWYVCSDDGIGSKFIKLWQNGTENIQGSIDLSDIVEGPTICTLNSNRKINIIGRKLYTFTDKGFDNQTDYYYQSANLSNYSDKKILSVSLNNYEINANNGSYKFYISADENGWQACLNNSVTLENNQDLPTFYIKTVFKAGNQEYSPWFDGINIISYQASDRN